LNQLASDVAAFALQSLAWLSCHQMFTTNPCTSPHAAECTAIFSVEEQLLRVLKQPVDSA
jgi:hypothetical protein